MLSSTIFVSSTNIFFSAYKQSDVFGRLIILVLIGLSLVCWLVLLHKTWQNRDVKKLSARFLKAFQQIKQPVLSIDSDKLPKPRTKSTPHPFGVVFQEAKQKTLEILEKNHYFIRKKHGEEATAVFLAPSDLELIESHLATVISSETKRLEKHLFILSTIVTLAPFLGLLGTVWGILVTFSGLQTGGSASSNTVILGGLSTALATTVLGLVIAIPALIAFNTLKASLKHVSSDLDDYGYHLLGQIELAYRNVEVK
jgi:biopolymer transport protein TolQ